MTIFVCRVPCNVFTSIQEENTVSISIFCVPTVNTYSSNLGPQSQLLDFDVSANFGNWNYAAGVGADPRAARYFNIPKQVALYDADGAYTRQWLPEAGSGHAVPPIVPLAFDSVKAAVRRPPRASKVGAAVGAVGAIGAGDRHDAGAT